MHANERDEISEVRAGDIAAAVGLNDVTTGDTLTDERQVITLERIIFPQPVISVALKPRTEGDQQRLGPALQKLAEEDPTLRVGADPESGQVLISGMGELHLEVIADRLRCEFNVELNAGRPQVAYRETIRETVEQEGRFVRQSGGRGQYGHVVLRLAPLPTGSGFQFESVADGGVVPAVYLPAIEEGIREQMGSGVGGGFPLVDIKVTLLDGSHHKTDSSEASFRIASAMAFKEGCANAGSVLLEPIMRVEVVTPEQFMGDINGDLSRRRGIVRDVDESAAGKIIRADVPLAELFGYATSLRSLSQGRATHSMEFTRYAEVLLNARPVNSRKH
jgi:elongation factor G